MLLKISEAARKVNVSDPTIRNHIKKNELTPTKRGNVTHVESAELYRLYPNGRIVAPTPEGTCRVIAITNQKGGVGKTTTTINLGACLAASGFRVLAVNCDPQGNMTQGFGLTPEQLPLQLYDVMVNGELLPNAVVVPYPVELSSLFVVGSADLMLASIDEELSGEIGREFRLRYVLKDFLSQYDYILLDCPPSLSLLPLNALIAATEVIIPVDMASFAVKGLVALLQTIGKVEVFNPGLVIARWALANRSTRTNLAMDVLDDLKGSFRENMFKTIIPQTVRIPEAQALGKPVSMVSPRDPVTAAYRALAEEVVACARH